MNLGVMLISYGVWFYQQTYLNHSMRFTLEESFKLFLFLQLCAWWWFFVGLSKEKNILEELFRTPYKTSKFPCFPQRFWVSVKLVLTLGSEVILSFPCRWQLKHFWNFYPELWTQGKWSPIWLAMFVKWVGEKHHQLVPRFRFPLEKSTTLGGFHCTQPNPKWSRRNHHETWGY